MSAHEAAPVGGTTGHGKIDGDATIISRCRGCGIALAPAQPPSHSLCRACWSYGRLRAAVMAHRTITGGPGERWRT